MHKLTVFALVLLLFGSLSGCRDKGTESSPEYSAYTIVYDAGDGWIYTMDASGSSKTRLDLSGDMPKYFPSGKKIAVFHWFDNPREQWVASYDQSTGTLKRIAFAKGQDVYAIRSYSMSRDGAKIAYSKPIVGLVRSDLYVVDSAGLETKQLTTLAANYFPIWSPDGKTISFVRITTEDSSIVAYLINVDGSGERPVPYLAPGLASPVEWSPDGKYVAFCGKYDPSLRLTPWNDVFVADVEGTNVRRLTFDGNSGRPKWSPDGRSLLFVSERDGGENLYVMNPDGSNQRAVTKHGRVFPAEFLWSPDGRRIAYVYEVVPMDKFSIHTINADGTDDVDTGAEFLWGFDWKPM